MSKKLYLSSDVTMRVDATSIADLTLRNEPDIMVKLAKGIVGELWEPNDVKKIALHAMIHLQRERPDLADEVYKTAKKRVECC